MAAQGMAGNTVLDLCLTFTVLNAYLRKKFCDGSETKLGAPSFHLGRKQTSKIIQRVVVQVRNNDGSK